MNPLNHKYRDHTTISSTIRQAMNDWDNATDEQGADALAGAAALANAASNAVRIAELEAQRDEAWREANIQADNCNTAELSANNLQAELKALKLERRTP